MPTEREVYQDTSEAIKRLVRNGVQVDVLHRLVNIPMNLHVGIKLWGAVDYLQRFGKFTWCRVR